MSDAAVHHLASRQFGLFSRAQVQALHPAADNLIRQRLASGRWLQVEPGVYSLPGWPSSWRRSLWLAHLDAGPQSVISHEAAAALHRLLHFPAGAVTLLTRHPDHHRGPRPNYAHQSRDLKPEHVTVVDGLPVTTIPRTFCDLAATSGRGRIERALDDAHLTRRCAVTDVLALATELQRPGKRGLGTLAAALSERGPGQAVPESELERRLVAVLRKGGFTNLQLQHELPWRPHVPNRVDVLLDHAVIAEADSRRWHGRVDSMAEDRRRDREALNHGYPVYRFLYGEVTHEAEEICTTLRQALAVARRNRAAA
ncbi:MAG TPA: type IV toxin-antitoxin system AbiEi family antitoxin domain-containing protein [Acidimicrobiales bacterium]|jgi:very-short-patch-repair endonuclease|nr:type IV toxin-antitoxin system AbiEi family antitoxin domain-containing protein [Acidimicrobiales bacterium]